MIGKGTEQPGLDAESHGRNSPATTARKQEGRELRGQQERRSKITPANPKQEAGQVTGRGNRLHSHTPSSLRDGATSGGGRWGASTTEGGGANTALIPQQPPSISNCPPPTGNSTEEWQGLSPRLPQAAWPSPGKPAGGFPKPEQSWQACEDSFEPGSHTETAFPRSPASALPTPPVPPP